LQERFFIGRSIGRGGFGVTYLAYDQKRQRVCAIKEFFPTEFCQRINALRLEIVSDEFREEWNRQQEKFVFEANALRKIQEKKIPGVVQFIGLFQENNTTYIVMEFLQGDTLDVLLERQPNKTLPWEMAVNITLECLGTLGKIHDMGIMHRDISTSNIFIQPNGDIALIDFGIARYEAEQAQRPLTRNFKKQYSPPEQVHGKKQDASVDLYALAIVLFKLVIGGTPADGSAAPLPPVSKMTQVQDLPEWLDAILSKATQQDPKDRYPSAQAFANDLRAHMQRSASGGKRGGKGVRLGALLIGMLLAGGTAYYFFNTNDGPPPVIPQVTATPEATATPEPTPEPTPQPTPEPAFQFGESSTDIQLMQSALARMEYLQPEQCLGRLDFVTVRALARFALDYDCAFNGSAVTESFVALIHQVAQEDGVMSAELREQREPLSQEQRQQLTALAMEDEATPSPEELLEWANAAALETITAETVPALVEGRLGDVDTLLVMGTANSEEVLTIQLNGRYYTSIVPNPAGDWAVEIDTIQNPLEERTQIYLSYARAPEEGVLIDIVLDTECEPIEWTGVLDDASMMLEGQGEQGAWITASAGGESWHTQADENGWFTLEIAQLSQGTELHVLATDLVGNTWEDTLRVSRAERRQIEITSPEEDIWNAEYIAGDALPWTLAGIAQPKDALHVEINGVRESITADENGHWETEITGDRLIENQANTIAINYVDNRDAAKGKTLRAIYDPYCEPLVLLDSIYPSSRWMEGVTEANAVITLESQGLIFQAKADAEGAFMIAFDPLPYNAEVVITATDVAGNTSTQEVRVKEPLPPLLGKIVRPLDQEVLIGDRIAVSAWILSDEEVEGVLKLRAPNGRESVVELAENEVEAYSEQDFAVQQRTHKDEVAASGGFTIKTRIPGSRYGIRGGDGFYVLSLYARQGDEDILLAEHQFRVEQAVEEEDDELALLAGGGQGISQDAEEAALYVIDEARGYAAGLDELQVTAVSPDGFILTGWCYAPRGTTVSIDFEIDGELYSAGDLRRIFGGAIQLTRVFRLAEEEMAGGIEDIDMGNAGMIVSVRLPRIEPGERELTPMVIISTPDGSLYRHVLRPFVLRFDKDAQPASNVKEITDGWASDAQ